MRQSEYFAGRWDARRTYEWKTTVAIWTLLVGGIYFVKDTWLPGVWWKLLAVMLVLFGGYVCLWLMPLWRANDFDKSVGRFYRDQADNVIRNINITSFAQWEEGQRQRSFWTDWAMWFHMLSVLALGVLFFVVPRSTTPFIQP